jgi:guanylate kinase
LTHGGGYQQSGRRGKLIVLAGPSGVGKGAIVARLLAALPDLELSISATTRGPRPREDEGRHYHFVDRDVLVEIDVQGARLVKAAEPRAFMVFITPPSLQELERRLRTRGSETDQQIRGRLAKASDELAAEPEFDVTVVNDDLETAAREVVEIVDRLRRRTINGGHTRVKERKH